MEKNYNFRKLTLTNILCACFLIVSSYTSMAQNINFTIDTATDNVVNITETIVSGTDTYVLTIDHANDKETLDDLGGGDLVFYLGDANDPRPFLLSLTKNGTITNFKLISIDYDAVAAGNIALANQDDAEISLSTNYVIGAGTLTITNAANAMSITEIKIIPGDADDLIAFGFHNINIDVLDTLGIEGNNLNESFSIFPNPSNGLITIRNNGIVLETITVSDLNGRTINTLKLNGTIANKTLDLSSKLYSGVYFVSVSSEKGSMTKKLIIN